MWVEFDDHFSATSRIRSNKRGSICAFWLPARIFGKCALACRHHVCKRTKFREHSFSVQSVHSSKKLPCNSKVNLDFSEYLEAELEDILFPSHGSVNGKSWEHCWATCWLVATVSGTLFVECGHWSFLTASVTGPRKLVWKFGGYFEPSWVYEYWKPEGFSFKSWNHDFVTLNVVKTIINHPPNQHK